MDMSVCPFVTSFIPMSVIYDNLLYSGRKPHMDVSNMEGVSIIAGACNMASASDTIGANNIANTSNIVGVSNIEGTAPGSLAL